VLGPSSRRAVATWAENCDDLPLGEVEGARVGWDGCVR
jgi:hypothetical protein